MKNISVFTYRTTHHYIFKFLVKLWFINYTTTGDTVT